jgi:predicted anti-sigma-YlaC factor YlaD
MIRWRKTTACERASQWISLDLDGELTELERAALARHLERCDGCRAASDEIGGFTSLLREAPLVGLARPAVVDSPGRARFRATRRAAVVALAAAAAVVASLMALPNSSTTSASSLGFRNAQDQRRFAQEHVRIEPTVFFVAYVVPAPSFASRALR